MAGRWSRAPAQLGRRQGVPLLCLAAPGSVSVAAERGPAPVRVPQRAGGAGRRAPLGAGAGRHLESSRVLGYRPAKLRGQHPGPAAGAVPTAGAVSRVGRGRPARGRPAGSPEGRTPGGAAAGGRHLHRVRRPLRCLLGDDASGAAGTAARRPHARSAGVALQASSRPRGAWIFTVCEGIGCWPTPSFAARTWRRSACAACGWWTTSRSMVPRSSSFPSFRQP